jgi:glutamate-1-semialdehyde aminotransferase
LTDRVAGFTSTGSKRREALFGEDPGDAPRRMSRSAGCRVWDEQGREYVDYIMALGAVALGYGHPAVAAAAHAAVDAGVVGPLAPELEETVAAELCRLIPWVEQVRFV